MISLGDKLGEFIASSIKGQSAFIEQRGNYHLIEGFVDLDRIGDDILDFLDHYGRETR